MRGRALALVLAASLAAPALVGAAPVVKINESDPILFSTPGICTEVVDAGGYVHNLGSVTFSNTGNYKLSFHFNLQNVTGVGESSGDNYTVAATGNISVAGKVTNSTPSRFTAVFNGTLTDVDTLAVVSVHVNVQFTLNAKGTLTASVINVQAICPGP